MAAVSAAEKYAEGPRPLCECCGVEMRWGSDARTKAGGRWLCVEKDREWLRAYSAANREKVRKKKRAYYAANREKVLESYRAYYAANREKLNKGKRVREEKQRTLGLCARCDEPSNGWAYCELHRDKRWQQQMRRALTQRIAHREQQISSLTAELETLATALGIPKEALLEAVN